MPYAFLGDDAFALKEFMMKPFPQQNLTPDEWIYNYRYTRARTISENLFGILANRGRIYFTTINVKPKIVKDVVLTRLVLHNMLIRSSDSLNVYRPASLVDNVDENGNLTKREWGKDITGDTFYPLQTPRSGLNAKTPAKAIRDEFKDYFIAEGVLEWQWKYC